MKSIMEFGSFSGLQLVSVGQSKSTRGLKNTSGFKWQKRPPRFLFETLICTIAAPVLVFALLSEPAAWATSFTYDCISADHKLGFRFKSNCQGKMLEPDTHILRSFSLNSKGLFDREFPSNPPPRTFRILTIGGSMGANYKIGHGMGPSLESIFTKNWGENFKKSGFDRVEVISGSEMGYNLIQSYLRMEELTSAYHPHMVIILDSLLTLTEEFLFHVRCNERNMSSGLCTASGFPPQFWPLPQIADRLIWGLPGADFARALSDAIQVVKIKFRSKIQPSTYCEKDVQENCFLYWHKKYLVEMNRSLKAQKILFFVLTGYSDNAVYKKTRWLLGSSIAQLIAPWPIINSTEAKIFINNAKKSDISIFEVTDIVETAYSRQMAQSSNEENHLLLTEPNAIWAYEQTGSAIFPGLRKLILERFPPEPQLTK